jgi:signal transduction histidine kinase
MDNKYYHFLPIKRILSLLFILFFGLFPYMASAQINSSQSIPTITNYSSKEYRGSAQIWSIDQDHRGFMYFGTSTQNLGVTVEISVSDNGSGIPESVKSKIFQPFFTTKPTGQGTGLGLSLSYDIIKAHGGEIKVESLPAGNAGEEGKGTIFTISIPIDKKILL